MAVDSVRISGTGTVTEGSGNSAAFSVYRTGDLTSALTVFVRFGGSARPGSDYNLSPSKSFVFPVGSSSLTITVTPIDDTIYKGDRDVVASLLNDSHYSVLIGIVPARITIIDNDPSVAPVPTVATAAAASPNPVTSTTAALSVLGTDDGGEAALSYTWATTGTPPAAVTFSANGTNAAKSSTATFTAAGSYIIQCTIKDAGNLTVASPVTVTVNQTATSVAVTPASANVVITQTQQYSAVVKDQFGAALTAQPAITWSPASVTSGTLSVTGFFTANTTVGGPYTLTATSGSASGTATVTVVNAAPTVATAAIASPNPVTGKTTLLSVLGADDGGEANLTYTWATTGTPPSAVTFSANGTNAAKSSTATFSKAGSYSIRVTARDADGLAVFQDCTVNVTAKATSISITPSSPFIIAGNSRTFTGSVKDQFSQLVSPQPAITWSVSGGGSINSITGFYQSSAVPGMARIIAGGGAMMAGLPVTATSGLAMQINFQPGSSATPFGYDSDTGAVFGAKSNGLSYGWNVGHSDMTRDRNVNSDQRLDTLAQFHAGGEWRCAVPNGEYVVRVTIGDPSNASTHTVNVQGVSYWNATPLAANVFQQKASIVIVSDGSLRINQGSGAEAATRICSVEIYEKGATSTLQGASAQINMQPNALTPPTGYVADSGSIYGAQTGGMTYGWNVSHADSVFQRQINSTPRLDTVCRIKASANWKVAVPNGYYNVRVTVGDPAAVSQNTIRVQGISYWSVLSLAANQFATFTKRVQISNGQITIDTNLAADKSTSLCSIEYYRCDYGAITLTQPGMINGQVPLIVAITESTGNHTIGLSNGAVLVGGGTSRTVSGPSVLNTGITYGTVAGMTSITIDGVSASSSTAIAVTIGAITRGDSLPDSIPPGWQRFVPVTITPNLVNTGISVFFNVSPGPGGATAEITMGAQREVSGNIGITASSQSARGGADTLFVRASTSDNPLNDIATSNAFYICDHPRNISLQPINRDENTATHIGMQADELFTSDSGNTGNLTKCAITECIGQNPVVHYDDPPYLGPWNNNIIVGWLMPAENGFFVDNHLMPKSKLKPTQQNPSGHIIILQGHVFHCYRCLAYLKPVPNGGFTYVSGQPLLH